MTKEEIKSFEAERDNIWRNARISVALTGQGCAECLAIRYIGWGPSHEGQPFCRSGSIASGGTAAHCACDSCF